MAANGINNAGRQGVSFAAWAVPAQQTTNETKRRRTTQRNPLQPSRPWHPSACKRDFSLSHTSRGSSKPSAKDELATTNYSYGRTKAATLKANYLPTYAAVQGSRVQQWTASEVAAAREGPRAAKEAQCVRPYVALQAPSLAARRRAITTKPALRLGLCPSQAGSHEGRAEHKRLLCRRDQQGPWQAPSRRPAKRQHWLDGGQKARQSIQGGAKRLSGTTQ